MTAGTGSVDPWIRSLAEEARFGVRDRIGTAHLIDDAARLRAADAIAVGSAVSIARPVTETPSWFGSGTANAVQLTYEERPGFDGFVIGSDQVVLEPHGALNTHLDALNHVGMDHHWYSNWDLTEQADVGSLSEWAATGLVTRAIYINVPGLRGNEWVSEDDPVTGPEIDQALADADVDFAAGDALLIDCGRDRFEAAGNDLFADGISPSPTYTTKRAGVGFDTGRWIVEHGASILCWDMLDAEHPASEHGSKMIHLLVWAIGLLLVDNCDFSALRAARGGASGVAGSLVIAPLSLGEATGCVVNPLIIT